MSTRRLPLPLELTAPVLLADALNTQLQQGYSTHTQLCSSTCSHMRCKSVDHTGVQIDVTVDVQVDDVLA